MADQQTQILDDRLRLGTGFRDDERDRVLEQLQALEKRLAHFKPDSVDLEISVKERDGADQKLTLEAWIGGLPHFAVSSSSPEMAIALREVREELARQIGDAIDKRDPHRNKHLRQPSA